MPNWTPEQEEIFKAVKAGKSIHVSAVPGSGKTTTLAYASTRVPPGLVLAYNVSIKKTAEKNFVPGSACMTLNGLGHRTLGKLIPKNLFLDEKKVFRLCKDADLGDDFTPVLHLVNAAKTLGFVPDGSPGDYSSLFEDTPEDWELIADALDLDFHPHQISKARAILIQSNFEALSGNIDFSDQIYIPTLWHAPFQKYSRIYLDETQDLNEIQHRMIRKSLAKDGQLIGAGDKFQSIYGFRGAMDNSVSELIRAFNLQSLPMTFSFRCAKAIVAHAQEINAAIRCTASAPLGEVNFWESWGLHNISNTDAILCRNNAPLISLAYKFISQGRNVQLKSLTNLGFKTLIESFKTDSIKDLEKKLIEWEITQVAQANSKGKFKKATRINDRAVALRTIIKNSHTTTTSQLLAHIALLFSNRTGPVLSTGHKAKGLEWPKVWHLNPDLISHETQQEINLDYVIRTRAMLSLNYITERGLS